MADKNTSLTEQVCFSLERELVEELRRRAEAEGRSLGNLVRFLATPALRKGVKR